MAHATRDFVHSESEYIKSVAESLDPWAQVQARSTTDAQQALANIDQQNKMFAQAGQQLDQLRKMGLNQNVIDVLGLSDPKNMQQLNRFFTDVAASPDLVGAFNESIKGRLDWTAGLATNESSTQWQAMEYQFNTAASDAADSFTTTSDRAQAAFEKQQTRSETAFDKMLGRNATDFQTMTQQSQADFALQMANMASDYETSVQRSLSAVNDFANEAYGTNDQIMSAAMATASGNMKIFFQNISDAYGVMKSGVDAASAGAIAAAAGGSPALGTANNRNATAGTLGYNESGQVGTYDASGKFSPYTGFVGQALANSLPQIANPTTASNAIDANTANMTVSDHMAIMKKALAIAGMEVSAANLNMLDILISHESGWNPNAINLWDSNAKAGHPSQGLMQTIPSTFEGNRDKRLPDSITNPIANMVAGLNYVKNRYGSLGNLAGEKSVAHGGPWIGYAAGGLFNAPKNIQVGEAGPEMVLPLNNRGVDFLLSVSRQLNNDGWAARNSNQYASRVAPSISTTTVDSSTNFTGPVTVQAQDPNAMADALKQKARMMALTRPDMVSGLV
jgi:SLT domain-containing protein